MSGPLRPLIRAVACLAAGGLLLAAPAVAGLFGDSVDLEDLARLSDAGIEALRPTEHAAFLARIRLATAQENEGAAKGSLKTAERILDAEKLDLKAAQAEEKAAKANADPSRIEVAQTLVRSAETELEIAKRLVEWRDKELDAARSAVSTGKARLDLAEAERDLARVVRLIEEKVPAAAKYDRGKVEDSVRKRQRDLDKAAKKSEKKREESESARAAYEKILPPETE